MRLACSSNMVKCVGILKITGARHKCKLSDKDAITCSPHMLYSSAPHGHHFVLMYDVLLQLVDKLPFIQLVPEDAGHASMESSTRLPQSILTFN